MPSWIKLPREVDLGQLHSLAEAYEPNYFSRYLSDTAQFGSLALCGFHGYNKTRDLNNLRNRKRFITEHLCAGLPSETARRRAEELAMLTESGILFIVGFIPSLIRNNWYFNVKAVLEHTVMFLP